jgi:hypothetical protein
VNSRQRGSEINPTVSASSTALTKTIAIVRVATAVFFLLFGQYKLFGPGFAHGGFQEYLRGYIEGSSIAKVCALAAVANNSTRAIRAMLIDRVFLRYFMRISLPLSFGKYRTTREQNRAGSARIAPEEGL